MPRLLVDPGNGIRVVRSQDGTSHEVMEDAWAMKIQSSLECGTEILFLTARKGFGNF